MRHRLSLVLVLLASCQSELTTSAPVVFDGQVWAGGTLKIASSAFNSPTLPIVLLGNDTLVVQRLDSITVQARVPDTSGTLSLSVAEFGRWTSLGAIVVHGFATSVPIAHIDQVYGSGALPWPESSATFIIRVNGQYQLLDPRAASLTAFFPGSPFTPDCQPYGPISAGGDLLVMTAGTGGAVPCRTYVVQPVSATLVPVDSNSVLAGWLRTGRLSDATWLGLAQWSIVLARPGGGSGVVNYGEGAAFAVSPSGDRAVPVGGRAYPGDTLPVLQAVSAPVVLHVPATWGALAAAFDETGDTAYLLGGPWSIGSPSLLKAYLPGASIISSVTDSLPDHIHPFPSMDVALDPGHPWLYVAYVDSTRFTLVVYDRRSMSVAAVMHPVPGSFDPYAIVRLAVDPIRRRLGAVVIPGPGPFSLVRSLDLMP